MLHDWHPKWTATLWLRLLIFQHILHICFSGELHHRNERVFFSQQLRHKLLLSTSKAFFYITTYEHGLLNSWASALVFLIKMSICFIQIFPLSWGRHIFNTTQHKRSEGSDSPQDYSSAGVGGEVGNPAGAVGCEMEKNVEFRPLPQGVADETLCSLTPPDP